MKLEPSGGPRACRIAHRVLLRVAQDDAYADRALNVALERAGLTGRDRGLATELVYGTLRHLVHLDFIIAQLSDRPMRNLQPPVLAALRLGVYQLLHTRVPPPVAVNDSVNLIAEDYRHASGYVNAVLRKVATLNDHRQLPEPHDDVDPLAALAIRESHPRWVLDEVLKLRDAGGLEAWMRANNERPPLSLRVNRLRATREQLAEAIAGVRGEVTLPAEFPDTLWVRGAGYVGELPGFAEGWFAVQDPAAQLVATLVDPKPGQAVLDACAAPGGKATHLAELAGDQGVVLATDVHPAKTRLIASNAERLGLRSLRLEALDATEPEVLGRWLAQQGQPKVAAALVDAPCTGFGTLRRNPELRARGPAIMRELCALQDRLLDAAASVLAPDGVLVYAVCTVTEPEGPGRVTAFLRRHPEFVVGPIENPVLRPFVERCKQLPGEPEVVRTWTDLHAADSFFAVRLVHGR